MRVLAALSARPAPELAVAIAFVSRSVLGWFAASPVISAVSALGAGALDGGDRALFAPSGMFLIELLRLGQIPLLAAAKTLVPVLCFALALNVLPTALLFSVFSRGERDLRRATLVALAAAPRFVLLGMAEILVLGVLVFLGGALWPILPSPEAGLGAAAIALALLLGLGVVTVVSIVVDLARAVATATESGLSRSLGRALESFRCDPLTLVSGYTLAAGTGALCVALSARGVELCGVEQEGAFRVFLAFLTHQGSLLTLTVIQAGWVRRLGQITEHSF